MIQFREGRPVSLLAVLLACLPGFLHGHDWHLGKKLTICFNLYYDPNLGGREKELASAFEVAPDGRITTIGLWTEEVTLDRICEVRVTGRRDRPTRLNFVFSDPARGLLSPAVVVSRVLSRWDGNQSLVLYVDFLPCAPK